MEELYRDLIMRHNREPAGFERREGAGLILEAYNPLCGDQFRLYLDVEAGIVRRATFHGYGCAISKASTSVLVQRLEGLRLEEVAALAARFYAVVREGDEPPPEADEELLAFAAARRFPGRLTCATLSWDAVMRWVEGREG